VWGPLIFESRRFVELRQKSLWKQITSAESTGLGLFYTLNIFCIQVHSCATPGSPANCTMTARFWCVAYELLVPYQ